MSDAGTTIDVVVAFLLFGWLCHQRGWCIGYEEATEESMQEET